MQREQRKMPISQPSLEEIYLHTLKPAAWGPASNQPADRGPLLWDTDRPQLLGATKNKVDSLDNHKGLRHNQELGQGWATKFISYMRPLLQDWERWPFYLIHRNQHRESRKMKKQRMMFQKKEQDKTSEKDLNGMEISDLPDKTSKLWS